MLATTNATFKHDVLESEKAVLLDVWAPWCGPCRGMNPIVEEIANEVADWAEVIKLDASVEMEMAQTLGVSALPTFLILKNGQVVDTVIGATTKTKLLEMLSKTR